VGDAHCYSIYLLWGRIIKLVIFADPKTNLVEYAKPIFTTINAVALFI